MTSNALSEARKVGFLVASLNASDDTGAWAQETSSAKSLYVQVWPLPANPAKSQVTVSWEFLQIDPLSKVRVGNEVDRLAQTLVGRHPGATCLANPKQRFLGPFPMHVAWDVASQFAQMCGSIVPVSDGEVA